MQSTHFYIMGSSRTYWDFYVGFGLFVSVFLLLAVVLAWQLGRLPPESLALMRGTREPHKSGVDPDLLTLALGI